MKQESDSKPLQEVQKYFVDPRHPESAEDLAQFSADAIRVMAEIYATGGRIDDMSLNTQEWLTTHEDMVDRLKGVLGNVLAEESQTRRFDEKFMGQIHPQGSKIAALGNLIAAYMNTNTVVCEVSKSENKMESEVLNWFADLFGYDKQEFSGNVVSGGTTANMTALWAAREKKKMELEEQKMHAKPLYVVGTQMAHYSIAKACNMLEMQFVEVPSDHFKTDPNAMEKTIQEIQKKGGAVVALIGLAGETETGLIDDLDALADIAVKHGVHFHVDAAYGGPFILSNSKELFDGIHRADSITVDPHKLMFTDYPSGVILFKDKRVQMLIEKNMKERARYLLKTGTQCDTSARNYGMSRVEGSMGSAGVISTWATIQLLQKEGLSALLNHTLDMTKYAYDKVNASSVLRALHKPEINTLLIGLSQDIKDAFSKEEYNAIVDEARSRLEKAMGYYVSCNNEVDEGWNAFRLVPTHPYSTNTDVEILLTHLEREVVELLEEND